MLYTDDGILFDYIHKSLENQKKFSEMKVKKNGVYSYLLENTTLTIEDVEEIEDGQLETIGEIVEGKTDTTIPSTFVGIVNSVSDMLNRKDLIFYMNVLYGLGYKASDFLKLNQKEIVQVFVIEVVYNKTKLDKDYIFKNLKEIFDEKVALEFVDSFGLSAINKQEEDRELADLSEALSQL
ncbi:MAG: hypothetical protein ACRC5T_06425 [Cetobacterium sp.]